MKDIRKKKLKQPAIFSVAWQQLMSEVRVLGDSCVSTTAYFGCVENLLQILQ